MSLTPTTNGDMPPFSSLRSILALMLREMGSTYGDSPGGYAWAIIQPVGMIIILTLGFSLLVRTPSLGSSFILFYSTGYLAYDLYNQMAKKVGNALIYSKTMLAYPRVLWIDTVIARFLLNLVTLLTVFCIIITGVLAVVTSKTILDLEPIVVGLSMAALIGAGVGLMNCLLSGLFPVWTIIWKIVTRPMLIVSGVLFIYEDMPSLVQDILWWNPILHITGYMRTGFYPTYHANYVSLEYVFGIALVLIATGLLFLQSYHKNILSR